MVTPEIGIVQRSAVSPGWYLVPEPSHTILSNTNGAGEGLVTHVSGYSPAPPSGSLSMDEAFGIRHQMWSVLRERREHLPRFREGKHCPRTRRVRMRHQLCSALRQRCEHVAPESRRCACVVCVYECASVTFVSRVTVRHAHTKRVATELPCNSGTLF